MILRPIRGQPIGFSDNCCKSLRQCWNFLNVSETLRFRQLNAYQSTFWQIYWFIQHNRPVLYMSFIWHFYTPVIDSTIITHRCQQWACVKNVGFVF